jgi:hypothetical protein
MIHATQGSLTMVGLNTSSPQVFWNGKAVPGIVAIKTEWEDDEARVKLKVDGADDALYMELVAAGIVVKKEK